eukprot:COSAG03_NODE_25512_length_265_cov_0.620482_1_plen_53_part_10
MSEWACPLQPKNKFVIADKGRLGVRLAVMLFFKQKTAYEIRIRDWSSDVCSSD